MISGANVNYSGQGGQNHMVKRVNANQSNNSTNKSLHNDKT